MLQQRPAFAFYTLLICSLKLIKYAHNLELLTLTSTDFCKVASTS